MMNRSHRVVSEDKLGSHKWTYDVLSGVGKGGQGL